MADNTQLNVGALGDVIASAEVTFSGDTAKVQIVGVGLMSGAAESYAVAFADAGAGAVGTGVQRITLASDDPAVVEPLVVDDLPDAEPCLCHRGSLAGEARDFAQPFARSLLPRRSPEHLQKLHLFPEVALSSVRAGSRTFRLCALWRPVVDIVVRCITLDHNVYRAHNDYSIPVTPPAGRARPGGS